MRVAVAYKDGNITKDIGSTHKFMLYNIEDDKVVSCRVIGTNQTGDLSLATLLKHDMMDAIICGEIDDESKEKVAEKEVKLYSGVQGSANEALNKMIKGELK